MEASVRSFLEKELTKVARWDEVVGLRLKLFISILASFSGIALDGSLLLVRPY